MGETPMPRGMRMSDLWNELASRASVTLTDEQRARLSQYLDLLLEGNTRMNLTRITERSQAELNHVGDALTVLPLLPAGPHQLADVGSGGGVPGIPLAIARHDVRVLLIESTKKKAAFLRDAIKQLDLANVEVTDQRAEDVAHLPDRREQFDVAIARAVATMDWLVEWCVPLVKKGGKFLAMKGPKVAEEMPSIKKAINLTGGSDPIVHQVDLPGTDHRVIVEIPKVGRSDKRYPRPATQAKGKPLGGS